MDPSRLAIVIPAYNEEATIQGVVGNVTHLGQVFVVDDASTDATAVLAEEAGAIVVRQARNQGYDAALEAGFKAASLSDASAVITMDADGQHRISDVEKVAQQLVEGQELVLGVRDSKARLAERIFAAVLYARWHIRDPLSGLKGYSMRLYCKEGFFDQRRSTGTELMVRALRRGVKAREIPIEIIPRLSENPRFGGIFTANKRILSSLWRVLPLLFGLRSRSLESWRDPRGTR